MVSLPHDGCFREASISMAHQTSKTSLSGKKFAVVNLIGMEF